MHTPNNQIDFLENATEIAEWIERNYGFFVNKNSDKVKIVQDFAKHLERLPMGAMSYIQQAKNNFIDTGIKHPPSPVAFIQELKICFNSNKKPIATPQQSKVRIIFENLYKINNDFDKIKYIKEIKNKELLRLRNKSIVSMEIEAILMRNNFNENEIREIIGS